MIFATVGTQLPFDRLIQMIDQIAPTLDEKVFAQIGADPAYKPINIDYVLVLRPAEFARRMAECRVIISHAGIGSILTARKLGKPIIVVPRQLKFGEHRNDHQLATCRGVGGRPGIFVASTAEELEELLRSPHLSVADVQDADAEPPLAVALAGLFRDLHGRMRR